MGSAASISKKKKKMAKKFVKNDDRDEKEIFMAINSFDIAADIAPPEIYMIMGDMMTNDEIIRVKGQYRWRKFRKWQMYVKAIDAKPIENEAEMYVKLAYCLPATMETVTFKDKRVLSRRQMFLMALDMDPTLADPYVELVKEMRDPLKERIQFLNGTTKTLRDLMTLVVSLDANIAHVYYYLGITLSDDKKRLRVYLHGSEDNKGRVFSRRDFFMTCLELSPTHPEANAALASILKENENEIVVNGNLYTKRQLCLNGLLAKYPLCSTNCDLATTMEDDESIELLDGKTVTKIDVLITATSLDPMSVRAHHMLSRAMKATGTASCLMHGREMTLMDLGILLIKLDLKLAPAYDLIASLLKNPDDSIEDSSGRVLTKRDLYQTAISVDRKYARAYYNLAVMQSQLSHKLKLWDGRVMSQLDLYLHTIELDESFAAAYNNIAVQLVSAAEQVPLNNGSVISKKQLLIKAIALDPGFVAAYRNLGAILRSQDEVVELKDGRRFTMQQLLDYT
jgi:hypothetical protein